MNFLSKLFNKKRNNQSTGLDTPKLVNMTYPYTYNFSSLDILLHISLQEINTGNSLISGVCFRTEGLQRHGKKEMILIIAKESEDFAKIPFDLFLLFESLVLEQHTDIGDYASFSTSLWGWDSLVYAPTKNLDPGLDSDQFVNIVLLTKKELKTVMDCGFLRVLAMLGESVRYFPYPYWNNLDRSELPVQNLERESIIYRTSEIFGLSHGSVSLFQNTSVQLRIAAALTMTSQTEQPDGNFVVILPHWNSNWDGLACWPSPKDGANMLVPHHQNIEMLGGCFLALANYGEEIESKVILKEDGFIVFLNKNHWSQFWSAFINKKPFSFPGIEKEWGFELIWE